MAAPNTHRAVVLVPRTSPGPVAVKPPRLSFTGQCSYCARFGCRSSACVRRHRASVWAVCDQCEGTGAGPDGFSCFCLWGVVEVPAESAGEVA